MKVDQTVQHNRINTSSEPQMMIISPVLDLASVSIWVYGPGYLNQANQYNHYIYFKFSEHHISFTV